MASDFFRSLSVTYAFKSQLFIHRFGARGIRERERGREEKGKREDGNSRIKFDTHASAHSGRRNVGESPEEKVRYPWVPNVWYRMSPGRRHVDWSLGATWNSHRTLSTCIPFVHAGYSHSCTFRSHLPHRPSRIPPIVTIATVVSRRLRNWRNERIVVSIPESAWEINPSCPRNFPDSRLFQSRVCL